MTDRIQLAEVLQKELKGKIISKVAKELKISTSMLHEYVNGHRAPSGKNLIIIKKLADYLNLTLEELLFGSQEIKREVITSTSFKDGDTEYLVKVEKIRKDS